MKALIIIACVIAYFVMWLVTAVISYRREWIDEDAMISAASSFFWWFIIPFGCIYELVCIIDDWLDKKKEETE